RQTTIWRRNGIYLPISINVTVSDFSVPGFASALEKQVLEAGLACRDFRIECLETDKVLESEVALMELDLLKAKGFLILLDDFGAGYSNINYLRRLPIDVIKLDRSLISQITHDEASLVIVRNVIVMLKELDYEVLAEGVEDQATARILKDFGCDEVQGFYFSRPLRPEDIPAWMGRRNLLEGIE
ncbi:EAL domain-containing protein, partial [Atlantibacter hermannii]